MAAPMAWQPQEEPLRQLAGWLRDSLSGHNQLAQKQATELLSQAKTYPDINHYLVYLFISPHPPPSLTLSADDFQTARYAAGIMLKNDIRDGYARISETSLAYVKSSILLGLRDTDTQIRNLTGNVVTEIVRQGGVLAWQQLIPDLLAMVANEEGNLTPGNQEGAMSALVKVCEDNRKVLDRDYRGQRPLNVIIPKLVSLTESPLPKIRSMAVRGINVFISSKPQALLVSLDVLLARLFQLANDPYSEVRKLVCHAFVLIIEVRPDKILPHMEGLVDYMITQQTRSPEDPELALEAAEFWLNVAEHHGLKSSLGPYLPKIIPVLLDSMVYSDEEQLELQGETDDAEEEDKAEDIRPQFAAVKAARQTAASAHGPQANGAGAEAAADLADADDDLSEGEIEDDYGTAERGEDPEDQWTLRKCSAAALDVLASVFPDSVFDITLPYLKLNLRHTEWPRREAAVLALGAVATGCMDAVGPHLPDLVPYLISLLNDPQPVVRSITCWTLGRYVGWAVDLSDPARKTQYFEPLMEGLLTKMMDNNKRVQEAAASAFITLGGQAASGLIPYCEPIVRQLVQCFPKYKDKNIGILYECIETLAEHVGPILASPTTIDLLMPALIQRWNKLSDQARELFPLQACLTYVATAMGAAITVYAPPFFARCIRIIHQNLSDYLAAVNNDALDPPDKDFLVTSLDLVSAIIQAADQAKTIELVTSSQPPFFDLLAFCMEDPRWPVRQSAYAVLGDCAIYLPAQLKAALPGLMKLLLRQLDMDGHLDEEIESGFGVTSNGCWSVGEICYNMPDSLEPYVESIFQRLTSIILSPEVPESVHENAAIALGRLCNVAPQKLGAHLGDFAEEFLDIIEKVDWTEEKDSAFEGFARAVAFNPRAMENCLPKYFEAIARYKIVMHADVPRGQRLRPIFHDTVTGYRGMMPDFNGFLSRLDPKDQQALRRNYDV